MSGEAVGKLCAAVKGLLECTHANPVAPGDRRVSAGKGKLFAVSVILVEDALRQLEAAPAAAPVGEVEKEIRDRLYDCQADRATLDETAELLFRLVFTPALTAAQASGTKCRHCDGEPATYCETAVLEVSRKAAGTARDDTWDKAQATVITALRRRADLAIRDRAVAALGEAVLRARREGGA